MLVPIRRGSPSRCLSSRRRATQARAMGSGRSNRVAPPLCVEYAACIPKQSTSTGFTTKMACGARRSHADGYQGLCCCRNRRAHGLWEAMHQARTAFRLEHLATHMPGSATLSQVQVRVMQPHGTRDSDQTVREVAPRASRYRHWRRASLSETH